MTVDVVVPVYNAEKTIGGTLEAIVALRAGGDSPETFVVDDGSTDRSAEIASSFPGIHLIRLANGGPSRARNAGWKAGGGDVVFFTDSDCVPSPGWVDGLLPCFEDPTVGAAGGGYGIANPGSPLARLVQGEIRDRHASMPEFVRAIGSYNMAVRRDVLAAVGGFDERFATSSGEDNDLSFKIVEAGYRIAFRPLCLVAHHHPERLLKYLGTQFAHGYWRSLLYRLHAGFVTGDDYCRARDMLDSLLALACLAAAPLSPVFPHAAPAVAAASAAALAATEGFHSWRIARAGADPALFPLGTAVFFLRSFWRVAGLALGFVLRPKGRATAGSIAVSRGGRAG